MLFCNRWIMVSGLAGLVLAAGGCSQKQATDATPQAQTFQTMDLLVRQVDSIPDAKKREEVMGTVERLRGQMTFCEIKQTPAGVVRELPEAARLLLVKEIQILPMTQVADWNGDGAPDGFEVQIAAMDHFGDPTKLVGKVCFELFEYRSHHADHRQLERTAYWEVNIENADDCLRFWDRFHRAYHFNLVWPNVPDIGRKYIFQVTYVAPWGEVLEAQRTLTRTTPKATTPN